MCEKKLHDNEIASEYVFAGPLNLNRAKKQASTVIGGELILNECEFEALCLLAVNMDEYVTFGQIYEASWGTDETTANPDYATSALEDLIQHINQTGTGFMWIEHTPELGYTFKTRWGRKWNGNETKKEQAPDNIIQLEPLSDDTQHKSFRLTKRVTTMIAGAGSIAAAIVLVLLLLYSTGIIQPQEPEPILIEVEIEDSSVPLASPDQFD